MGAGSATRSSATYGTDPSTPPRHCHGGGGLVALLANAALGWAVARHAGWIEPSWISSWSATPDALTIDYPLAPVVVHYHDPHDLKVRSYDPARLQLGADEAEVAELIRLAVRQPTPVAGFLAANRSALNRPTPGPG